MKKRKLGNERILRSLKQHLIVKNKRSSRGSMTCSFFCLWFLPGWPTSWGRLSRWGLPIPRKRRDFRRDWKARVRPLRTAAEALRIEHKSWEERGAESIWISNTEVQSYICLTPENKIVITVLDTGIKRIPTFSFNYICLTPENEIIIVILIV